MSIRLVLRGQGLLLFFVVVFFLKSINLTAPHYVGASWGRSGFSNNDILGVSSEQVAVIMTINAFTKQRMGSMLRMLVFSQPEVASG